MSDKKRRLSLVEDLADQEQDLQGTFLTNHNHLRERDRFLREIRTFALSIPENQFEEKMTRVWEDVGCRLPASITRALAALGELVEDGYIRFAAADRGDGIKRSTLAVFHDLAYDDVKEFLRAFEEPLFDFYIYAELRKAIYVDRRPGDVRQLRRHTPTFEHPISISNGIKNLTVEAFQAELTAELFANGLEVLAKALASPLYFEPADIAERLPVIFYSPDAVIGVFDRQGAQGDIEQRISKTSDLWDQLLNDPKGPSTRRIFEQLKNETKNPNHHHRHPSSGLLGATQSIQGPAESSGPVRELGRVSLVLHRGGLYEPGK